MNDDEHFAALVRTSLPCLDDNGFSTRVLSSLPAPKTARVFYGRMIVCGAAGLAGAVVAWQRGASAVAWNLAAERLSEASLQALASLVDYRVVVALAATCFSLIYAFRSQLKNELKI